MQLTGHIDEQGKLLLPNNKRLQQWIKMHPDKDIILDIDVKKKRRSNRQNAYYWGVVIPLVQEGINEFGNDFDKNDVHEFLKAQFNYKEVEVNEGYYIKVPKSTTGLATVDMMSYLEKIQQFAASVLGIVIPNPNEQTAIDFLNK